MYTFEELKPEGREFQILKAATVAKWKCEQTEQITDWRLTT